MLSAQLDEIKAGIHIAADKEHPDVFTPLPESVCIRILNRNEGEAYPVYISTVETPAKETEIPMKLDLDYAEFQGFSADSELPSWIQETIEAKEKEDPSWMMNQVYEYDFDSPGAQEYSRLYSDWTGDHRIHVMIDGAEVGCTYLKDAQIENDKGWKYNLTGFRVARCHERGFVLNPLPDGIGDVMGGVGERGGERGQVVQDGNEDSDIPNSGFRWVQRSAATGNAQPLPMASDPTNPLATGLPPDVSVVQVTITVGKINATVDKYIMFGASQPPGLYVPPQPDPTCLSPSGKHWKPTVGPDAPGAGPTPQSHKKKKKGKWVPADYSNRPENIIFNASKNPASWRPIGLAPFETKIKQVKEVQFTAAQHLVRFLFFIVPPQTRKNKTAGKEASSQTSEPQDAEDQQDEKNTEPAVRESGDAAGGSVAPSGESIPPDSVSKNFMNDANEVKTEHTNALLNRSFTGFEPKDRAKIFTSWDTADNSIGGKTSMLTTNTPRNSLSDIEAIIAGGSGSIHQTSYRARHANGSFVQDNSARHPPNPYARPRENVRGLQNTSPFHTAVDPAHKWSMGNAGQAYPGFYNYALPGNAGVNGPSSVVGNRMSDIEDWRSQGWSYPQSGASTQQPQFPIPAPAFVDPAQMNGLRTGGSFQDMDQWRSQGWNYPQSGGSTQQPQFPVPAPVFVDPAQMNGLPTGGSASFQGMDEWRAQGWEPHPGNEYRRSHQGIVDRGDAYNMAPAPHFNWRANQDMVGHREVEPMAPSPHSMISKPEFGNKRSASPSGETPENKMPRLGSSIVEFENCPAVEGGD
ncbi:hypothetical protein BZA05DRAFT_474413 [Tricharina praecox]|uniref:uncharacterized protein n=1 Tax=Tricharina praecox TaxID=43433 RepID=UPI0022210D2B|nr:uncharacterized protein BZA05DRAFT_474413 [Tricharina praecox]KAI5850657.1 hypothetical protein BZA05DRAFT_474413 [Tricharina praecox]